MKRKLTTPGMKNWRDLNRPLKDEEIVPIILTGVVIFILYQVFTQI